MKRHIQLFEEFINEEDPLAALTSDGGDDKKKEDPINKQKAEAKRKEKIVLKKHDEYVDKKKNKIEDILKDYPEIDKELGAKIIDAVNSQDRVKIHNMFNDLMYLQVKYQDQGEEAKVNHLSKLKDQLEDLDKSYTDDKLM